MDAERRRDILEQLNTLDAGPTEEDRRAEQDARIKKALETEDALKWGRFSAGAMWGVFGRSAEYR
jgi:hypothetical protein